MQRLTRYGLWLGGGLDVRVEEDDGRVQVFQGRLEPPQFAFMVRDLPRDLGALGDQAGNDMRHCHAAMVESHVAGGGYLPKGELAP